MKFAWLRRIARDRAVRLEVRAQVYYSTADWTLLVTCDNLILQCSNTPSLYFSLSYVPWGFLWQWHIEGSRNEKRQAEKITKQNRQGKTSGVPVAKIYGFWNSLLYLSPMAYWHSRIASVKDYWLCILTVGWLAVTGWQMTSAAEMPGSRILGPSSGATIINPASAELTSQPGAPQPLCRSYGDRGVTQTLFFWLFFPVLLFHTFIYMSPDFAIDLYCGLVYLVSACHSCHVGGLAPLQIATSHYTHPDKLQTSDVLHPSKIPKPWWVSSIRNCFSHTMSVI